MRDATVYRGLISEFLRAKVTLFGAVALRRAREIPGLEVRDDGEVLDLQGDGLETLARALEVFERLSGKASTISARSAVHRLRLHERFPDLELPPSLR